MMVLGALGHANQLKIDASTAANGLNNGSGSNGEEGKHGSNMGDRSGSGNETDLCEKDGNGTSKINGDPPGATP